MMMRMIMLATLTLIMMTTVMMVTTMTVMVMTIKVMGMIMTLMMVMMDGGGFDLSCAAQMIFILTLPADGTTMIVLFWDRYYQQAQNYFTQSFVAHLLLSYHHLIVSSNVILRMTHLAKLQAMASSDITRMLNAPQDVDIVEIFGSMS